MIPTNRAPVENRDGDAEEFLASFRVARINLRVPQAITFRPRSPEEFEVDWDLWLEAIFAPLLARAFVQACNATGAPDLEGVLAADTKVETGLDDASAKSSRQAGEELFLALEGARHLGVPARYREQVLEGRTPGHFAVALATRCAAFHVPPVAALYGLCYLEWFGGRLDVIGPAREHHFLAASGAALAHCRKAALAARPPRFHLA